MRVKRESVVVGMVRAVEPHTPGLARGKLRVPLRVRSQSAAQDKFPELLPAPLPFFTARVLLVNRFYPSIKRASNRAENDRTIQTSAKTCLCCPVFPGLLFGGFQYLWVGFMGVRTLHIYVFGRI